MDLFHITHPLTNDRNSAAMSSQLEELDLQRLTSALPDVETLEAFAERNGLTPDTVRAWAQKAVIPSLRLGKRRMVNTAMLRNWLLEQEWTA